MRAGGAEERSGYRLPSVLPFLLVAAMTIPLLLPAIPPLTDLPGHMARYHIERALGGSANLQRFYDYHWILSGNLGMDLLIVPMADLFGVELGSKLLVIAIPAMLAAGFLGAARELHGRIPPTALFALPLAYHHAFQFGFVNFSLSVAFCFLAFWLWLRLGRLGRTRLRAALFVPIACLIWLSHIYGWGMLGVLAFAAQAAGRRQRGEGWPKSLLRGALDCLPLALPVILMLIWRGGTGQSDTGDFFNWPLKASWAISILRERWQFWDMACAALLLALVMLGLVGRSLSIEPRARLALILLFLLYLIIPRVLLTSGYADMRLAAFVVAVGLVGLEPGKDWSPPALRLAMLAALLFVGARLAGTTAAFAQLDRAWRAQLQAVNHITPGSRVLVLTSVRCGEWADDRFDHVSSIAVVRRDVFTNGQWTIPGAHALQLKYHGNPPFTLDPSHLMRRLPCRDAERDIPLALSKLPGAFDYLWLVGLPRAQWPTGTGLTPIWQSENGLLLKAPTNGTPTGG
jgi:hypothetical protein